MFEVGRRPSWERRGEEVGEERAEEGSPPGTWKRLVFGKMRG